MSDAPPAAIDQALKRAISLHQSGRLDEAERIYHQILAQQPDHARALHYLGVIAYQAGRTDSAAELIRRAIALDPNSPEAHSNLANVLKDNGQLDESIAACRQAIALSPNVPEAHHHLGLALAANGQTDDAIAAFRHAIVLRPDYAQAHNSLGNALLMQGQLDEAIAAYRHVIALNPRQAAAHSNLGNALRENRQLDEAIAACRQAIALSPNLPEARYNLGIALADNRQLDGAIAAYRQAIALKPNYAQAHGNLGAALAAKGQFDEAVAAYRQVIALNPNLAMAYHNLGGALALKGQLDEALAAYRRAIAIDPTLHGAHGDLAYTLHFHPAYDPRAIAEEHRLWNQRHAEPLRKFIIPHPNDPNPDRPLRIGYVSPDFHDHVVGRNLLPLFRHHDRQRFHITCYAQVPHPDAITTQFIQLSDAWCSTVGLSDDQLAAQIRDDRIDILVDLTLHMTGNRLLVFARKPAPVQVTFASYPASTGLTAIDYRLSDPFLDPPGIDESLYSERTIRLPDSFWCYDPLDDADIPVNSLPALQTGYVTFACLNNFAKTNTTILSLWAQVLLQVQNSRLHLMALPGSHRRQVLDHLSHEGIDPARIEFISPRPRAEYLRFYHRIDLSLDSFPYNGHTTSLESFWMGVPVVTLVGKHPVSRAGWCQLSNLALGELAAQTPDQFVRIAVELARDLSRLQELRRTLRSRMEQSPLMDAPKFARDIESAYHQMWKTWCHPSTS